MTLMTYHIAWSEYALMEKWVNLIIRVGYSHKFYTVNCGAGFFKGESKRRDVQCFVLGNSGVHVY